MKKLFTFLMALVICVGANAQTTDRAPSSNATQSKAQKEQASLNTSEVSQTKVPQSFYQAPSKGVVEIGTGVLKDYYPVNPYFNYSYTQSIYLQSELGAAGIITQIWYYFAGDSLSKSNNWTIYIGHTSKTQFSSKSDWVPLANLTQVYSSTFTDPGAPGWILLDIAGFAYNGTGNLVIAVDENSAGHNSTVDRFYSSTVTNNRSLVFYDDTSNPNPASPPVADEMKAVVPNVRLFIDVLSNNVVQVGTGTLTKYTPVNPHFNYTYSQSIYLQSELGAAGNITQIWYYFSGSSLSNSNNWTIYMGHTAKAQFSSQTDWEPLANLTQVYSSTFTDPGGPGWILFNITDFAYNGTDNLVIAVDENSADCNTVTDKFYSSTTTDFRCLVYYSDATNPNPSAPPAASIYEKNLANIRLIIAPTYKVVFKVMNATVPVPVMTAKILIPALGLDAFSNQNGYLVVPDVEPGQYSYSVSKADFVTYNGIFEVVDQEILVNVELAHTSIAEFNVNVSVGPNPTKGIINVTADQNYLVEVYDLTGRIIQSVNMNNNNATIDITSESNGMYIIRFTNENGTGNVKIIKE